MVLSGLRGVGKTVLLNALRSHAVNRAWGTGKIEARPEQSIRVPVAQAVHAAVREVAHRHRDPDRVDQVAGVLKAFALRAGPADRKGIRWTPPVEVAATKGRADSGDLELDLVELFTDVGTLAGDLGVGVALFVDEMQDIAAPELAAVCGAVHELSQQASPVLVVGAGLPHLPVALASAKSYAERLFRYVSVDRLPREMADRAWRLPAAEEGVEFEPAALDELYRLTDGYPYFVQAYGKVTWDAAVASPITAADVARGRPRSRGGAGRRVLRSPVRARDPRRAGLHDRDGRPRQSRRPRPRRRPRRHRRTSPATSAASRRASPRRATG